MIWFYENRDQLRKPGQSVAGSLKAAALLWIDIADKSEWKRKAVEDRERYEREMAEHEAEKGISSMKIDGMPNHGQSPGAGDKDEPDAPARSTRQIPFRIWFRENSECLLLPGKSVADSLKAAAVVWLTIEDKSEWERKAAEANGQ